jgi:hypothetical protein
MQTIRISPQNGDLRWFKDRFVKDFRTVAYSIGNLTFKSRLFVKNGSKFTGFLRKTGKYGISIM